MALEQVSPTTFDAVAAPVRLIDEPEYTTSGDLIHEQVRRELADLTAQSYDAGAVDVAPHYELPIDTQQEVDRQSHAIGRIADKNEASDTLFDGSVHSAGAVWAALNKRAIALWALKTAGMEGDHPIAPSIDPDIYREPLFDGRSALDVLHAEHPRSAALVAERYDAITTTSIEDEPYIGSRDDSRYLRFVDDNGFAELRSRDFLTGVLDSRAVDTRAIAAGDLALEHVLQDPEIRAGRPIVTASLACGAAAPMFELNQRFAAAGVNVARNVLVDNDPMALASAVALGRAYDMEDKVDARLEDIVGRELTDFIEPHSVDVVDILGIVDYLPTSIARYRAAENFVGKIANIMKPGGVIVAGNALKSRPHQAFFDKVWPTLQQRDPREMVDIFEAAGYRPADIKVHVPQREGVYGVYAVKVPETGLVFREGRTQEAAKRILTLMSRFNKY